MFRRRTVCLIRYPFDLADSWTPEGQTLRLKIQYHDGLVVYLNGREVARRNAPEDPKWRSNATADVLLGDPGEDILVPLEPDLPGWSERSWFLRDDGRSLRNRVSGRTAR